MTLKDSKLDKNQRCIIRSGDGSLYIGSKNVWVHWVSNIDDAWLFEKVTTAKTFITVCKKKKFWRAEDIKNLESAQIITTKVLGPAYCL